MVSQLKFQLFLRGIRQTEVARAAGVHFSFINRIVNGKQKCSKKVAEAFKKFGIEVESETTRR